MKVAHLGFLTDDLEKVSADFIKLGFEFTDRFNDTHQNIDIVFLKNDDTIIEIIKPLKNSIIKEDFLEKYKNKFYHVAFKVDNIDETIKSLKLLINIITITPKMPAIAFKNKNVQFLLTNIGMIELIEI